jgi:hypothetical protein
MILSLFGARATPFYTMTGEDKAKLGAFEDAVVDRPFVIHARHAEEERLMGQGASGRTKNAGGSRKGAGGGEEEGRRKKKVGEGQLTLGGEEKESRSPTR